MVKRPIASIAAISSTVGLIMVSTFYYMFQNLESLNSDKIITGYDFPENQHQGSKAAQEISPSRIWDRVYFPTDDYDGQELGRKIGDWVVEKIKS